MSIVVVQHFLRRAKDFESSMKMCQESSLMAEIEFPSSSTSRDNERLQSAALLAIHSAISYADALRTALGDSELSAEDHRTAEARLRQALVNRRIDDPKGLHRFGALLAKKSAVAYSRNRIGDNELKSIVESCQRFSVWINQIGKRLKAEGWENAAAE